MTRRYDAPELSTIESTLKSVLKQVLDGCVEGFPAKAFGTIDVSAESAMRITVRVLLDPPDTNGAYKCEELHASLPLVEYKSVMVTGMREDIRTAMTWRENGAKVPDSPPPSEEGTCWRIDATAIKELEGEWRSWNGGGRGWGMFSRFLKSRGRLNMNKMGEWLYVPLDNCIGHIGTLDQRTLAERRGRKRSRAKKDDSSIREWRNALTTFEDIG